MTIPVCKRKREKFDERRRAAQVSATESRLTSQPIPPSNPEHAGIVERDEFRYTDTRTIRRGDLFKLSGGPLHNGVPCGTRGIFRFESAWCQGKRWYMTCYTVDPDAIDRKTGRVSIDSVRVLFIQGVPYPHESIPNRMMHPYRIHRLLDETARKTGLEGMTRSAAAGSLLRSR